MDPALIAAWMVSRIGSVTGLASLSGRAFPDIAPPSTPNPCLVYQMIENTFAEVLDSGPATEGTIAFQIRIYTDRRASSNALRESFRKAFQGLAPRSIGTDAGVPWRLTGSGFTDLADTHEEGTEDYGALAVVSFHLSRR